MRDICVCIVIVNYGTAALVIDCLRSLEAERKALPRIRVVVTDNKSPDDSVVKIRSAIESNAWSSWVTLLPMERNGGFAAGNNEGIRHALASSLPHDRPTYFYLLNPDTIVRTGAVSTLVDFLESHLDVGIAGGSLEDQDGRIESAAHRFISPLGELEHAAKSGPISRLLCRYAYTMPYVAEPFPCDWVSGATLMIRNSVLEAVGLMDEGFFLYFEEVEFCFRVKARGWSCWSVPRSRVLHLEGSATGIHHCGNRRAPYWYSSRRRYFVKCHGVVGLVIADMCWTIGRLIRFARNTLFWWRRANINEPARFASDLLIGDIKALITGTLLSKPTPGPAR